jgi:hypothetical protein
MRFARAQTLWKVGEGQVNLFRHLRIQKAQMARSSREYVPKGRGFKAATLERVNQDGCLAKKRLAAIL